ncbi:putative E3 ubiquitin-protein ligase SIRP1 [Cocos nucifera]|uniref:RING-type E3 ubiquitin transferase n=1 Tax=Cocos nucifera TaxID=13894 RepID=A0A8K0J1Z5_COCNU|nr:putative E3 ubiquitin-protein ligase SIRP1 [Cocos nucifera]
MEGKEDKGLQLDDFIVGNLPTLCYIPNFITESEQAQLLHHHLAFNGNIYIYPAIQPHQDGPAYFPIVAIISLESPVLIDFIAHPRLREDSATCTIAAKAGTEGSLGESLCRREVDHDPCSLLLMPCSLLIFKDQAYADYLHGIQDSELCSLEKVLNVSEVKKLQAQELPCDPVEAKDSNGTGQNKKVEEKGRKKMDETLVGRYWCHMCLLMVNPVMEVEIKCPHCNNGFVEEMDGGGELDATDLGSDRALSLWAPILLGMMSSGSRRGRHQREEQEDDPSSDHYLEALRRRRRSSVIVQLLQALRETTRSESDNSEGERERERDRERERERVILINPFNQAIILQGSFDNGETQRQNSNSSSIGASLEDYFLGPGLNLLLQHLAENDPNRYGTPPARKEAIDAMPTVKIEEAMSCSVCLEDFEIGGEAREMPCKHKFHCGCILPWLELHSSCPVCRFQMPADESKDSNGGGNSDRVEGGSGDGGDGGNGGNGRRFWVPVPWPFNGLFSSQSSGNSSSAQPSSSSSGSNSA